MSCSKRGARMRAKQQHPVEHNVPTATCAASTQLNCRLPHAARQQVMQHTEAR
jgi:hypothetical protein